MRFKVDYSLYLVTDRKLMSMVSLEEAVEQAILGGVSLVQLREKQASTWEFYQIALKVKSVTDRYRVPLIINDRVDIALAVDSCGVHVGQQDLPVVKTRELLGNHKIVGVSVSCLKEAEKAQADGADYLGVGAMFTTDTKTDAHTVSIKELKRIRSAVSLPIVVIGGINKDTISCFMGLGVDGIAVVSAIISASDIKAAAKELTKLFRQINQEPKPF